jgi:SAM-dependent methyltransferase
MTAGAPLPPEIASIDYAARWREIVERRRAQMDAAYAASGTSSDDYWARRAPVYRRATHNPEREDPFVERVRAIVTPQTTLLDVGAGTGRHTLALAGDARAVTAVDPSPAMLGLLRSDLAERGITNVTCIDAEWMSVEVEPADVVICSHVLYPIADVVPFVRKLEAVARERAFIYLRADPIATDHGLWSEFWRVPLQGQPTHRDLFNVLAQCDIFADVEIVAGAFHWSFESLDEAVEQIAGSLCLRDGDSAAREKLRHLVRERFAPQPDGRLAPRQGAARAAIFSWRPPVG